MPRSRNSSKDAPNDSGLSRKARKRIFQNASASASVSLRTSMGDFSICYDDRFSSPLPSLRDWLKLLSPDATQPHDGGPGFHPVRRAPSIQRMQESPPISSHLLAFVLTLGEAIMREPLPAEHFLIPKRNPQA